MTPAISRILVATDFSASADAALAYALKLADQVGATVRLVHVFEDPDASLYSEVYVPMPPEQRAEILADMRRQLTARVTASGHGNITTDVLTGAAARTIVEGATEEHCDLIVMGTHGRHGMAHLLMGSVAERVVRTSVCPVLVVPSQATK
jgi:nucleotide-binding universal stress UspA family protein